MTITKASTSYKKQDGTLQFDDTKASVTWTPTAAGKVANTSIPLVDITNLQQTPASNPKCALRIVVQPTMASAAENHVFNFTNPTAARAEQEAVTDALRAAISALRAGATQTTSAGSTSVATSGSATAGNEGQSAAMAFAATATGSARSAAESWYDDQKLLSNHELQHSLLSKDAALRSRFEESLRSKPDGITNGQFSAQFWGARVHLLRAHAVERNQSQGAYNVLAEVKPRIVDGATKLNLSKEQIALIFAQHPLVKRVYNETVPKLSETEFWARFFVSKLFRKLKGERIGEDDARDAVLDRYLDADEDRLKKQQQAADDTRVPHFIDLEGNEQNHSQRQGNRPDFEMRPNAPDKVPILRVLNAMSEKMLDRVAPADEALYAPVGMDEETFNQLRLRDLQAESADDRVILTIKDGQRLFAGSSGTGGTSSELSEESRIYAKQDPALVLAQLNAELAGSIDLSTSSTPVPNLKHSDSDAGPSDPAADPNSTHASTAQILNLISHQRALLSSPTNNTTLPPSIFQSLLLTHSTSTEFLHYFYTLVLSPSTTALAFKREVPALLTTLSNSLARIEAVAADAEKERLAKVAEARKAAQEIAAKTGKKRRVDEKAAGGGGAEEVKTLMGPTIQAIEFAREKFGALAMGVAPANTKA